MRNYTNIESYLNLLLMDIYEQPPDEGHQKAAKNIIDKWLPLLPSVKTILDLGCGQGQMFKLLEKYGKVTGVTLGSDYLIAKQKGYNVYRQDFSFLEFETESFDLLFSRHSLEHSPMPLLTLMEWLRVSKQFLMVILPSLDHFKVGGKNHYYVLNKEQWIDLLNKSGWHPIWQDELKDPVPEYCFLCEKK